MPGVLIMLPVVRVVGLTAEHRSTGRAQAKVLCGVAAGALRRGGGADALVETMRTVGGRDPSGWHCDRDPLLRVCGFVRDRSDRHGALGI